MGYAVRFEEVTKRYPRGGPRYPSLRHELAEGARRLGQRLRGERPEPRGILALDRVSFEVEEGEAFAIIGPNGAGKSTALKLVSRISYPTGGRVRMRGRVAALIEVGSGVHPELTARENIWLYGQILGMPKSEIRRRFDDIVGFAELAHVLDTPVKLYSSGMQLRLGFAIASHLDPDVFVVDEALAVGDAGFQAKCVERMTRLVAEGRTLLFVSHNLSVVEAVCAKGIFLLGGRIQTVSSVREALLAYLNWVDERHVAGIPQHTHRSRTLALDHVSLHGDDGRERHVFDTGESLEVRFHVSASALVRQPWFSVGLSDGRPGTLILCSMLEHGHATDLPAGQHVVQCRIDTLPLAPRTYEVWMSVREETGAADLLEWAPVAAFRVNHDTRSENGPAALTAPWLYGPVRVPYRWFTDIPVGHDSDH